MAWLLGAWLTAAAAPLETTFTYQGELEVDNAPANGVFDFEFALFDAATMGGQVGAVLLIDDVDVDDGIFSVELDFGAMPFAGDQLWLEIAVRDGASAGGFTGLLPRQKLTAAPYALHAEMVAMDSISGVEIANNSITAADIGPNAVGASEIVSNAVGTSEIITSQVQRRVTGTCAPGSQVSGINEDGSVQCEGTASYANVINVATGGGDFTSVTEAMDAIGTDARYPAASDTNRYLIWVAPGVYTNENIFMQPYVDIQGSGEGVTVLQSVGGTGTLSTTGSTLVGASNAEVRYLTIESDASGPGLIHQAVYTQGATTFQNVTANARGGGEARAIVARSGGVVILVDVTASASGATDRNYGVDIESATIFADGLFAPVDGGADARGVRIRSATTEASLENVTVRVTGASFATYGVNVRFANVSLEGLRAFLDSSGGSASYGVLCTGVSSVLRLSDARIAVQTNGVSGETLGISIRSCDLDARGVVVDANATSGVRATGIQIFESDTSNASNITLTDVTSRTGATSAPASALVLTNGSGNGEIFGYVRNATLNVSGGDPAQNSHGIAHSTAGDVQYRGLTIEAGGAGNFVYGIQAREGPASFDDVVINNTASAESTAFGIELFNDGARASNARIRAINTGTGSGHDAVGIKANNASDVSFVDIAAFADAETQAWGADVINSQTRLVRVDARAGLSPSSFSYGLRCGGGTVELRDSVVTGLQPSSSWGLYSFNCNGEVFDSDLIGGSIGIQVVKNDGSADTTVVRDSYIKGTTTVRTSTEGTIKLIGSSLDGGMATSSSIPGSQECIAVTSNTNAVVGEVFTAGKVDCTTL